MSCFDMQQLHKGPMHTDWFHNRTQAQIRALPRHGGNLQTVNAYIHPFFDAHKRDIRQKVCVPINFPDPWPTPLDALYMVCNQNVDDAGMFLGCLFCRVAIIRPEVWLCSPLKIFTQRKDPAKWSPRHYVWGPDDWYRRLAA